MKKYFLLVLAFLAFICDVPATTTSIHLLDSTVTVKESSVFGNSKTLYQYNNKGSLIRQTRIYASWTKWKTGVPMIMNRKAVFVYDDEGHEIDLYYSSLDTATGKWTDDHRYLYDEWHNRTYSVGKWNADSTALLSGVRYFYDSNHFLTGNESFDTWNGIEVVTDKYFYTNDENGYKISMYGQFRPDSAYEGNYKSNPDKFNQSGWKFVDSAYYERNSAGQSIKETFFRWNESDNQWIKDGYQAFTYDEQGHLLTDTVYARDFETNIITYNNLTVRTYDTYGNMIRSTYYVPIVSDNQTLWQINYSSINEYTYDENNLIVSCRSYTDNNDGAQPNYTTTTYYYTTHNIAEDGTIINSCTTASGTCGAQGDNLTWELSCDSVLTISGTGEMQDYSSQAPWYENRKAIKSVIIEEGATNVGSRVFANCINLTSIIIPSSVTSIGYEAFYNCTGLVSIDIPNSVTSIGKRAFYWCDNLSTVTMGNGITKIEEYAFYKCVSLESVNLSNNIQSIGNYAYAYCQSLTSIALPHSLTTMGEEVFGMCTSLISVSLSENLVKISMGTFDGCTALQSIIVPEGVQTIEARAFYQCKSLESIELPSTITFIDGVAFSLPISFETALKTFTCHAILPPSLGYNVFEYLNPSANLIRLYVPSQSIDAYTTADQWSDFMNILPISGTEPCIIASGTCGAQGDNLTWELSCDSILSISGSGAMENYSFQNIPSWYSNRESIKEINLPEGITSIGAYAFRDFSKLAIINIPESVNSIGIYAFRNCSSLPVLNNLRYADTYLVEAVDKSLAAFTIKEGTKWIGTSAFYNCTNLTTIDIPNSVISLCGNAFSQSGITSIEIPNGVAIIGQSAFQSCHNLTSVIIPESVTTIESSAFYACSNLTSLEIPNSVTSLGNGVVSGCINLVTIKLPNSITSINGFSGCRSLESITIPESVKTVEGWAFNECIGLRSIICEPVTPPSVGSYAFEGVDKSVPVLYVPLDGLSAYSTANQWKDFANILPKDAYWVEFIDWDGTKIQSGWVKENTAAIPPLDPVREGYTFVGWDKEVNAVIQDTIINAIYQRMQFTVEFRNWNDTLIRMDIVDWNTAVVPPADPYREGHTFIGWDKPLNNITEDLIVTAQYSINHYPVVLLGHDGKLLSKQSVAYNHAAEAPEVPAREGYTFTGWTTDIEHITDTTYAIAVYDKIGGTVIYKAEDGEIIGSENVDLHLPAAPMISGKTFAGWLTESVDSESGIVLRATYTTDNPTTHDDVSVVPGSTTAAVNFPYITGALTYELVIRDLFGHVVCKILFNSTGHLLGIALAPGRDRSAAPAQTDGFNFTVEGLDPNTTYNYEFVAHDDTDEVIETLSGSFTTTDEISADMENVQSNNVQCKKELRNDYVYILRGDKVYTITGQEAK